jgi:hypothetical protein
MNSLKKILDKTRIVLLCVDAALCFGIFECTICEIIPYNPLLFWFSFAFLVAFLYFNHFFEVE